jgi:hypothetical protein
MFHFVFQAVVAIPRQVRGDAKARCIGMELPDW